MTDDRHLDGRARANEEAVGAMLRDIRIEQRLTLGDLSARTGIPLSTLSKIETGRSSLSYDKLQRLAHGLNVDIANLFAGQNLPTKKLPPFPPGRRSITRRGAGKPIDTNPYSYLYPASELLHKAFVPMLVEARCRTIEEFGELIRHPGEEFAIVMEGTIVFHTDVYAPERLEVGDSVFFDSAMGHAYLAGSAGICRVLSICSAASEQLDASHPHPIDDNQGE